MRKNLKNQTNLTKYRFASSQKTRKSLALYYVNVFEVMRIIRT